MRKNNSDNVNLNYEIVNKGNWNYKNKELKPVYTKPIAVIKIDQDSFVWKHEEILRLIKAYHEVDVKAMELISAGKAGSVKNIETPFSRKIKNFLNKLEEKNNKRFV